MQTEPLLKAPEAMELLQVKSSKFYKMQSDGLVVPVVFGARCIALFYREFSHAVLKPHFKPHPGGRLVAYQHGIKRTNKDKTTLFFNNL